MKNDKFNIIDENGIEKLAEVITIFEYKGRDYIIYSVDKNDEFSDIFVSRLIKDENGYDKLEDIDNPDEKTKIMTIVNEILSSLE